MHSFGELWKNLAIIWIHGWSSIHGGFLGSLGKFEKTPFLHHGCFCSYCWRCRNPANSPVESGNLKPHDLHVFFHTSQVNMSHYLQITLQGFADGRDTLGNPEGKSPKGSCLGREIPLFQGKNGENPWTINSSLPGGLHKRKACHSFGEIF